MRCVTVVKVLLNPGLAFRYSPLSSCLPSPFHLLVDPGFTPLQNIQNQRNSNQISNSREFQHGSVRLAASLQISAGRTEKVPRCGMHAGAFIAIGNLERGFPLWVRSVISYCSS